MFNSLKVNGGPSIAVVTCVCVFVWPAGMCVSMRVSVYWLIFSSSKTNTERENIIIIHLYFSGDWPMCPFPLILPEDNAV